MQHEQFPSRGQRWVGAPSESRRELRTRPVFQAATVLPTGELRAPACSLHEAISSPKLGQKRSCDPQLGHLPFGIKSGVVVNGIAEGLNEYRRGRAEKD